LDDGIELAENQDMDKIRLRACIALMGMLVATLACAQSATQSAAEQLKSLRARLSAARHEEKWAAYLATAQEQNRFLDGSPLSRLELARAQVHLHYDQGALEQLLVYAHMGQTSGFIDNSPEFASLRQLAAFAPIRRDLQLNTHPISLATLAVRLADSGLLPEDIDYDARRRRFMVTSVLQHKIVSVDSSGKVSDFARAPDGWPVLALKIDSQRQLLWATAVAVSGFTSIPKSERGRSALLCFDLNTARLVRRIEGPNPSALGDIALTADGDVIASDGDHGGVYLIKLGSNQWQRLDAGDFISPQTVAIAADGKHLFVPDYTRGIGILDIGTKQVAWVQSRGKFALGGIDGLYRVGNSLIAIQNGTEPERVIQFALDPSSSQILSETVIERSTSTLGDPTHGVMVAGAFYYLANSGWDVLSETGDIENGKGLTAAFIMRAALPLK
jgi:hypothetical protein